MPIIFNSEFTGLDWCVLGAYGVVLVWISHRFHTKQAADSDQFFLGGNTISSWLVAISVLATTQSAATFLGGPDQGYRGDYTYISATIAALISATIVAKVLIPVFYRLHVTTVYEVLEQRFGQVAKEAAALMYLLGRLFASGARVYLAAIAVSMILFSNIQFQSVGLSATLMVVAGFLLTFSGGIRSVVWSDAFQFVFYVGSAIIVFCILLQTIPLSLDQILHGLRDTPDDQNKLRLFNPDIDFRDPFTLLSIFTGLTLLNLANAGLDQDTTQRLLTCRNDKEGGKAMIVSVLISVPVIWLFISIGQLLHIYYDRPEMMNAAAGQPSGQYDGQTITVFMHYILHQMPAGLRGAVTVGVLAASISTITSGLNSMASVIVSDFYRPWRTRRTEASDAHFLLAGRCAMAAVGVALILMSCLCYYWQQYTDTPLLEFALSVMVFAYSGLLGVFCVALFTSRGSANSVIAALIIGFLATLLMQPYVAKLAGVPNAIADLAFTWKLTIGTLLAFLVCVAGNQNNTLTERSALI